jgi:hypothetical protein
MTSKAQVQALAAGDAWLEKGANLLMFGPPGVGKSHLAAALGLALIENVWRVLFARTTDLVQKLQLARRDLALEAAIDKLDKYHLLILDDLAYVAKDQAAYSTGEKQRSKDLKAKADPPRARQSNPHPACRSAIIKAKVHRKSACLIDAPRQSSQHRNQNVSRSERKAACKPWSGCSPSRRSSPASTLLPFRPMAANTAPVITSISRNPEPSSSSEGSGLDTSLISKSGDQTCRFHRSFEGEAATTLTLARLCLVREDFCRRP